MDNLMLGIDVGTQSIRIALVNENGNVIGMRQRTHFIETPKANWAVQDPDSWWNIIKEECPKLIEESNVKKEQIISIGVDGHMHAAVPVGYDGKLLSNEVQLYCDKRNSKIVDDFVVSDAWNEKLYNQTANFPITNWIAFKMKWIKENQPEVYEKTWKFLTTKDYINFCLTGNAVIDVSEASGTFLMNCDTCKWSDELINAIGIDKEKLPTIYESYECIGTVTEETAQVLGINPGVSVAAGCGDTMANLMVTGVTEYGVLADITGTGSTICLYTETPVKDKRLMNLRYSAKGWLAFGCLDSSGAAYRWFKDTVSENETYESLNVLAEKTEAGAEKLFFYPYLAGERTLGSVHSRGMFIGLSTRHTKGHMVRAIQEGIAFEHKRALEIMEDAGFNIECVYHSGGAAKGDLWNQIKADIYDTEVRTIEESESAVLGAALLGGNAAGLFDDILKKAKELLRVKKAYVPKESRQQVYKQHFEIYKEMHDVLQPSFIKLGNIDN
ncbi:MAG: FGGY family carbohydrate kinase [Eubacterium sp.]|nr:FGGY family carbohydrate kinase [Eubacterium sp.]